MYSCGYSISGYSTQTRAVLVDCSFSNTGSSGATESGSTHSYGATKSCSTQAKGCTFVITQIAAPQVESRMSGLNTWKSHKRLLGLKVSHGKHVLIVLNVNDKVVGVQINVFGVHGELMGTESTRSASLRRIVSSSGTSGDPPGSQIR